MDTPTGRQRKRAAIVQLYRPDIDATVNHFMITPSQTYTNIIEHIKAAFYGEKLALEQIWPCDVNGEPLLDGIEDAVSNFDSVEHGERILVGSERYERMKPEPELKVVLYIEDDTLPKAFRVCIAAVSNGFAL